MSKYYNHYREEPSYEELKEREREDYVEWYLNQKKNETDNNNSSNTPGSGGLPEKPNV